VEVIEPAGAETFLYFARGKRTLAVRMAGGNQAKVNEKLALSLDMTEARFFDPATGKAIAQG
jgi:ABC-type sugar transport system ATPase subunit